MTCTTTCSILVIFFKEDYTYHAVLIEENTVFIILCDIIHNAVLIEEILYS